MTLSSQFDPQCFYCLPLPCSTDILGNSAHFFSVISLFPYCPFHIPHFQSTLFPLMHFQMQLKHDFCLGCMPDVTMRQRLPASCYCSVSSLLTPTGPRLSLLSSVALALGALTAWHAVLISRGETSIERHINKKERRRLQEKGRVSSRAQVGRWVAELECCKHRPWLGLSR